MRRPRRLLPHADFRGWDVLDDARGGLCHDDCAARVLVLVRRRASRRTPVQGDVRMLPEPAQHAANSAAAATSAAAAVSTAPFATTEPAAAASVLPGRVLLDTVQRQGVWSERAEGVRGRDGCLLGARRVLGAPLGVRVRAGTRGQRAADDRAGSDGLPNQRRFRIEPLHSDGRVSAAELPASATANLAVRLCVRKRQDARQHGLRLRISHGQQLPAVQRHDGKQRGRMCAGVLRSDRLHWIRIHWWNHRQLPNLRLCVCDGRVQRGAGHGPRSVAVHALGGATSSESSSAEPSAASASTAARSPPVS